ncbi:MAG: hypothetical protein MZW92_75445 [Comamonadaceae bacterium]|nr:hypothetical protein [Comamonadaceae bacterium]
MLKLNSTKIYWLKKLLFWQKRQQFLIFPRLQQNKCHAGIGATIEEVKSNLPENAKFFEKKPALIAAAEGLFRIITEVLRGIK